MRNQQDVTNDRAKDKSEIGSAQGTITIGLGLCPRIFMTHDIEVSQARFFWFFGYIFTADTWGKLVSEKKADTRGKLVSGFWLYSVQRGTLAHFILSSISSKQSHQFFFGCEKHYS